MSIRKTILIVVVALLVAYAAVSFYRHEDGRLNVLLIIVDTLRPDHLACYGYNKIQTPNIDALAANGTLFRHVVSTAPITAPSIATILTSTYPMFHGVRDNDLFAMNSELPKLASQFQKAEYATAGFVASIVLDRKYGFDDGFNYYDDSMGDHFVIYDNRYAEQADQLRQTQRRANDITKAALKWLERQDRNTPFFCMVHYFDPHFVYDPPPPYKEIYNGAPYDGEVAYTDSEIGVILDGLRNLGLDKNTLVVFTSDHGEDLNEHGEGSHGFLLYDATVRVPLIICLPGRIMASHSISMQVRTVDIMPTILELAQLKVPETAQGISLVSMLEGIKESPPPAYIETYHTLYSNGWHEMQGMRTQQWKYVRAPESELYDLSADPGERTNIIEQRPKTAQQMEAILCMLEEKHSKGSDRYPADRPDLDLEQLKKMRTLGYISHPALETSGLPEPGENRPDPKIELKKWRIRQTARSFLQEAFAEARAGNFARAMELVSRAEQDAPDYLDVLAVKGLIVFRRGDVKEGVRLMESSLSKDPKGAFASLIHLHLASAYFDREDCPRAIVSLKRALDLQPKNLQVLYSLGQMYEKCGEPWKAAAIYEEYLQRNPSSGPDELTLKAKIRDLNSK